MAGLLTNQHTHIMKIKILFLIIFWATTQLVSAQTANVPDFDPAQSPIAVELDSNTVVSAVSDYVLIKSLKAQFPTVGRIRSVECIIGDKGAFLQYELNAKGKNNMPIFIEIPLTRNQQGGYFATGSGGVSCTGCDKCGPQSGAPCGCCSQVPPPSGSSMIGLKKVSTALVPLKNE